MQTQGYIRHVCMHKQVLFLALSAIAIKINFVINFTASTFDYMHTKTSFRNSSFMLISADCICINLVT